LIPSGSPPSPAHPAFTGATYGRLIRAYNRLLAKLDELPQRQLSPRMHRAYQRQFENRIFRIHTESAPRRWIAA
jgi:hypothetical protein